MPALTAEQLLTGIRSDLKSNLGGFRQAANDNNSQISKIIRDISRTFATQRADIASLEDSLEENTQETRQTAARIDGMISILQESVNIQMGMLSELRSMSYYIRLLAQNGSGSILGGGIGGFAQRVVSMTGAAAAGLLAGTAGEALLGGAGGESGNYGGKVTGNYWTPEKQKEVANYLVQKGGFTEWGAAGAVARMTKEASEGPTSKNDIGGGHWGVAQWSKSRAGKLFGDPDLQKQLDLYIQETRTGDAGARRAGEMFRSATNADQAAEAAMHFERAEGYKESGGTRDVLRYNTPVETVYSNVYGNPGDQKSENKSPAADAQPVQSSQQTTSYDSNTETGTTAVTKTSPGKTDAEKVDNKSADQLVTGKSLEGVNPALASAFLAAVKDYGRTVHVNSAVRSREEQEVLWNKKQRGEIRYPVAPPGTSLHEKGLAIDINEAIAEDMDRKGILAKHGLNRPVPGDPVHIQLMGTSKHKGEGPTMQEAGIRQETPQSPPPAAPQATPVSGGEVSSPTYSQSSMGADVNMMASMLSGFLPGGLGGIVSGIAPMLTEALSSIEAPNMLNQAAVQTQSNQEIAQERASVEPETPSASTGNPPQVIGQNNMGMPQYEFKNLEESDWPERFMFGLNQLLYGIGGIRFLS